MVSICRKQHTHGSIPPLGIGIVTDEAGIALLEVLRLGWLDCHIGSRAESTSRIGLLSLGYGLSVGSHRGVVDVIDGWVVW